jgi:hypothetical protein
VSRTELAPGRAWPIGRAKLDAAFAERGVEAPHAFYYPHRYASSVPPNAVLSVSWRPLFNSVGTRHEEVTSLWVYDVPVGVAHEIRNALVGELPNVVTWVADIPARGDGWRTMRHECIWTWDSSALLRVER